MANRWETSMNKEPVKGISGTSSNILEIMSKKLNDLVKYAYDLGATNVAVISTKKIIADNYLADLCKEPQCENFGLSKSCPPYVAGPSEFRKQLENFHQAIFFKIDVPSEILFSSERREIFQFLHQIAATIENEAIKKGYINAQAYAGGSCKKIFCRNHRECNVISHKGECRNPQHARPSMSGFGINVPKLFEAAGWTMSVVTHDTEATTSKMAHVCGLVLVF
jgi:predicted metal-binding protein